jgi:aminoglycoside phosphotransferase (APT) family kinase protein
MDNLSADVLRWVERTVGGGARIVGRDLLRAKQTQPTWLLHLSAARGPAAAVLKVSPPGWEGGVRREAAALQLIDDLGVPAPRLLGVDVTGELGSLLLLETVVPGTGTPEPGPPLGRMRALGAAAAHLHTLTLPPGHGLTRITKPVQQDDYIGARRQGQAATTPLLELAESVCATLTQPGHHEGLVHGDFHPQNVHWTNDRVVAYIDWDSAVGHPGIDLGWSRLEAALAYSPAAADEIAHGWAMVTGREPDSLGYWDLVAALQTHADLGTHTGRRDAFLRAALARTGNGHLPGYS